MSRDRPLLSRRSLLRRAGRGAVALLAAGGLARIAEAQTMPTQASGPRKLSEHLYVYEGPVNVGIIADGRRATLIDCGDARVLGCLAGLGVESVERVLFTHHHRDQACGAHLLTARGAKLIAPAAGRDWFDKVAQYWADPKSRWHLYDIHPHHIMLAEPVDLAGTVADGDAIAWGPAKVRVLTTPGHTDDSVSYVVDVDGRRFAFCGDAIYDDGVVWDLHSLQKGTPGVITDYHGFMGARDQLVASLRRLVGERPDALVPSHGHVMTNPAKAIDTLVERLEACYDKYVAISALRHYFPKLFAAYDGRAGHMPIRKGKAVPDCLRHFGTTWMLVSKAGGALVMDCGGPDAVKQVRQALQAGTIRSVEALWVTHYHDDHVDGIPAFREAFDCPCITDASVAEVIGDPLAWRLPCIAPHRIRVDRIPKEGESWQWHEFKLTAYHLPGQTLYHAGLLVEGAGLRMLFAGDSFTAAGIDDYCMGNRNWLGRDMGFDHCLALIDKLQPTHIFNPHVEDAFDFTAEQIRFMRANLAQREELFGRVVPWGHANFGMDDSWVRCHPYEQQSAAGAEAAFDVVVTNHAASSHQVAARAVPPRAWAQTAAEWSQTEVRPKCDGRVRLSVRIPAGAKPGRYVIPVDVRFGARELPQFTEAIVVVCPA